MPTDLQIFTIGHSSHPLGTFLWLLGKYGITDAVVSKYRVAHEEPVYDPEGVPRADFFTE